ncbi:MAG TPA: hypothetical protein VKV95_10355 [Terriglobia bacterium]|nr:hypothetical protein [Terriglobia bacterium]
MNKSRFEIKGRRRFVAAVEYVTVNWTANQQTRPRRASGARVLLGWMRDKQEVPWISV